MPTSTAAPPTPAVPPRRARVRRAIRRTLAGAVVAAVVVAAVPPVRRTALHGATGAALAVAGRWAPDVPPFGDLSHATRVLASDGRLLTTMQDENRRPLSLDDVPAHVRWAVLAAEDEDFYDHAGVDPVALARAAYRTARGGLQGGSTITQQLAKINFTAGERTLDRKVEEALIAAELERRHTKDELLERYLNQVYYGEQAYGLAAAARTFFDAEPAELTVAQAATLAGKIRSPHALDPRVSPAPVLRRRDAVLANMVEEGWLTPEEMAAARAEALALAPPRSTGSARLAPHFVELVKREAQGLEELGPDPVTRLQRLATGGFRVETTLDPSVFEATVAAARSHLGRPDDPLVATATVVPGDGAIRSLFGGLDFDATQFDEASLGARQPGSAFKPFVYLAALRQGIDPRSTFDGRSGRRIECYGERPVRNAGGRGAGRRVDVDRALVQSVNVVFVALGCEVGVDEVLRAAGDAGVPDDATEAQGAIFLGGLDRGVSALTMASAYATFASGGVYAAPYAIARILDGRGRVVYEHRPVHRRAFQGAEVGLLNGALQRVVQSGTGRSAAIGRPVAGKTGTTQDNGDAWFVGYVPQLATAVWVGFEPRRPMRRVHGRSVSGGSFPAAIFADVMRDALDGVAVEPLATSRPDELQLRRLRQAPSGGGERRRRRTTRTTAGPEAVAPDGGGTEAGRDDGTETEPADTGSAETRPADTERPEAPPTSGTGVKDEAPAKPPPTTGRGAGDTPPPDDPGPGTDRPEPLLPTPPAVAPDAGQASGNSSGGTQTTVFMVPAHTRLPSSSGAGANPPRARAQAKATSVAAARPAGKSVRISILGSFQAAAIPGDLRAQRLRTCATVFATRNRSYPD